MGCGRSESVRELLVDEGTNQRTSESPEDRKVVIRQQFTYGVKLYT
jgi:hypothetical protein